MWVVELFAEYQNDTASVTRPAPLDPCGSGA